MEKTVTFIDHSVTNLSEIVKGLVISDEKSYFFTYHHFIQYFRERTTLSQQDVIIGISFVYSWMPTILTINVQKLASATEIVNKAKRGEALKDEDFEILKECFNNSMVGTSKLLHFIDPEKYAIWDSNVCRFLTEKQPTNYAMKMVKNYMAYLDFCERLIGEAGFGSLKEQVGIKGISNMRALELIFFTAGKE